jgi:hypothetical protein
MSDSGGSFIDPGYYEAQRRNVNSQWAAQTAANTYGRFVSQQRGQRELNDMTKGFKQSFPGYASQFGQRGISQPGVSSGVMQRQMGQYVGDFNKQYARGTQDLTEQLRQFDLQNTQLSAQRTSALQDIKMQKAREIAFAAQNIEALKQILGGL